MKSQVNQQNHQLQQVNQHTDQVKGLSYGVLKEQEFYFRSKLQVGAQYEYNSTQQSAYPYAASQSTQASSQYMSKRGRAFSLPTQQHPPQFNKGYLNGHVVQQQQFQPYAQPPQVQFQSQEAYKYVPLEQQYFTPVSSQSYQPVYTNNASNYTQNIKLQDQWSRKSFNGVNGTLHTITEETCNLQIGRAQRLSTSSDQANILKTKTQYQKAFSRFQIGRKDLFMYGDPYSEKLARFVSKMVYIIFWQGTDSYQSILDEYQRSMNQNLSPDLKFKDPPELASLQGMSQMYEMSQFNPLHPSEEFFQYTKYILETMQISCCTALLALFYLHRLRPNVKQMFEPGTFEPQITPQHQPIYNSAGNNTPIKDNEHFKKNNLPPTPISPHDNAKQQQHKHQYKRDPKLEFRLFTTALILSNKYLDDNSYSNKAWSDVSGIELRKINLMEMEFLMFVDYQFLVHELEYILWVKWLESFIIHLQLNQEQMNETLIDQNNAGTFQKYKSMYQQKTRPRRRMTISNYQM